MVHVRRLVLDRLTPHDPDAVTVAESVADREGVTVGALLTDPDETVCGAVVVAGRRTPQD